MLVGGMRVLDPRVLDMRVLGMRVLGVPVSGVPILGRRVPGGSLVPGRRLRGLGLPGRTGGRVGGVPEVRAAEPVDAAGVRVNGSLAAVLGVDPSAFRRFAAKPTAMDTALWSSVANGAIAVSYTMGREAKLPVGSM